MRYPKERAIVYDYGTFPEVAIRLARDFGWVGYHVPQFGDVPHSNDALIGFGIPGVERVYDFFSEVRKDPKHTTVFFPDVYGADVQAECEAIGVPTWGMGPSSWLELDRWRTLQEMAKAGMPRPHAILLHGLNEVRKKVLGEWREHECWIKSKWRGDMETYHHKNPFETEAFLNEQSVNMGANRAEICEFILTDPIDPAVEAGNEWHVVNGVQAKAGQWGYEDKNKTYVGTHSPMPVPLKPYNDFLNKFYGKCRGPYSTEVRFKKGVGFGIDPCEREGSPPSEGKMELIANYSEVVFEGARGRLVEPTFTAKYVVQLVITAPWAVRSWTTLQFPPEHRQWIKLKRLHIDKNGQYWIVPAEVLDPTIGWIVSIGSSVNESRNKVKAIAKTIQGHKIEMNADDLDKMDKTIAEGEKIGLHFAA